MENNKQRKPGNSFLIAGLFIIAFVQIIDRFSHLPDFLKGILLGLGLACEIIALVKLKKQPGKIE